MGLRSHPAQRPPVGSPMAKDPIHNTSERLIGGFWPARASVGDCRVLCLLGNLRNRAFGGTKSHPAVGAQARQPVGQDSAVERYCRRHHRPRALRIAPVRKEPPAVLARGLRDQRKNRNKVCLDVEVTRSTREPHDYLPEESRNIIGPVDSARREALVREVPPAEEPAESAPNKRRCERSHRSEERDECAIKATDAGSWPDVE